MRNIKLFLLIIIALMLSAFFVLPVFADPTVIQETNPPTVAPTNPPTVAPTEPQTEPPTQDLPTEAPTNAPIVTTPAPIVTTVATTNPPETYPQYDGTLPPEETEIEIIDDGYYAGEWIPPTLEENQDWDEIVEHEMYESEEKANDNLMNKEDWAKLSEISLDNSQSNSNSPFKAIRDNAKSGKSGVNWLLYGGTIFLILSAAGFSYIFINIAKQRKKFGNAVTEKGKSPTGRRGGGAGRNAKRSSSDYGDGFSSSRNSKTSKENIFKFDTGDFNLDSSSRRSNTRRRYK